MPSRNVAVVLTWVALLGACGKKEGANGAAASASVGANATASAAASVSGKASTTRRSAIGGSFVMVGEFSVELALHRAGLVEALVSTPEGKLVTDAKLSISASGRSGASEPITLTFVPERARFEGHAQAGVELRSGLVELTLEIDGKTREGMLALAVVLEPPRLGGSVLAAGAFGVEALALASGDVFALVRNANGAAVNGGLDVEATLAVRAGGSEEVKLQFDAARALFAGKCRAGAELVPGPFTIQIHGGGNLHTGAVAKLELSARVASEIDAKAALAAELAGGAALALKGSAPSAGAKVDVSSPSAKVAAGAKAELAAPKVVVKPPKVQVQVAPVTAKKQAKAGAGAKASAGFSFGTK